MESCTFRYSFFNAKINILVDVSIIREFIVQHKMVKINGSMSIVGVKHLKSVLHQLFDWHKIVQLKIIENRCFCTTPTNQLHQLAYIGY